MQNIYEPRDSNLEEKAVKGSNLEKGGGMIQTLKFSTEAHKIC